MQSQMTSNNFVLILGTAQDGGYPHIGCYKQCCMEAKENPILRRMVASIAIIDRAKSKVWLIDVSPDINNQLDIVNANVSHFSFPYLSGIFLTHAHTGHYSGLLHLGLEGLNIKNVPIYVMPKMKDFLIKNSMFSQLVDNSIILKEIKNNLTINLNDEISIIAFNVPHRNELSETVGYKIKSCEKSIVYIPDIDYWDKGGVDLSQLVKQNDILLLDGTFYSKDEITHRNINKIPHPSILDTISLTKALSRQEKKKIFFTHLNHTNKAINDKTEKWKSVVSSGYNILNDKQIFNL